MTVWFYILIHFTLISAAVLCGVFMAFSDFIMRGFGNATPVAGAEAMQQLNITVYRSIFMVLFFATAVASVILIATGALHAFDGRGLVVAAGLIYLLFGFGVTAAFNVPLNTTLDQLGIGTDAAGAYFQETYLSRWTAWNWVRTVGCGTTAVLLLIALPVLGRTGQVPT